MEKMNGVLKGEIVSTEYLRQRGIMREQRNGGRMNKRTGMDSLTPAIVLHFGEGMLKGGYLRRRAVKCVFHPS